MKYLKICSKALDRIDKIKRNENEFKDCLKYKICPKCGGDLEESLLRKLGALYRGYKCNDCNFEW